MTCRFDRSDEPFRVDSNGCQRCDCDYTPKVKGRFGLAWVSESPDCPYPEPVGWQVEFHDTPSKVEQKCREMVRWINCPPLPRCEPCPPVELCCPYRKSSNNNGNKCSCKMDPPPPCCCKTQHSKMKCCCCNSHYPNPNHQRRRRCACDACTRSGSPRRSV